MASRLKGKVAVVTGAGSGIGAATAQLMAAEGARVVVAELNAASGAEVARSIEDAGGAAISVPTDVANREQVVRMFEQAVSHFGRIHVLVNNAATIYAKRLVDHSEEEWDHVFNVIVKGAYYACKWVIPHMIERRGGRIINVGSISGVVGLQEQGAYCAAKGALHQMTRQLAADHAADQIRINAVCPSAVKTPALDRFIEGTEDPEATRQAVLAAIPVGRFAEPEEIAEAIVYFASGESDYATGSIFMLDGGYTVI